MLQTSVGYNAKADANTRRFEPLLILHFGSNTTYPFATASATSADSGFEAGFACDGRISVNEILGTGRYLPTALRGKSYGWRSSEISNIFGIFEIPQIITIKYKEAESSASLYFIAGSLGIPKTFKVYLQNMQNEWELLTEVNDNNEDIWRTSISIERRILGFRLEILETQNPGAKVHIIETGIIRTVVLDKEEIVDMQLLEELKVDTSMPIGGICSNELDITLNNELGWYTQNSDAALFQNLVKQGIKLQAFLGMYNTDNLCEYLPLGKFYMTESDSPNDTLETSMVAYDELYTKGNLDVPELPVFYDVFISELISELLQAVGVPITRIKINLVKDFRVPVGWVPSGSVFNALNELCIAGHCCVFIDREENYQIRSNLEDLDPLVDWHDDNQIIRLANPLKVTDLCETVQVEFCRATEASTTDLINMDINSLVRGSTTFNSVALNGAPVSSVDMIQIVPGNNIKLTDLSIGANTISFVLQNSGEQSDLSINATGKAYTLIYSTTTAKDYNPALRGAQQFKISSNLIQNLKDAKIFSRSLLAYVTDISAKYEMNARGNLSLELMDAINVSSAIDNVMENKVLITKIKTIYDGGIEQELSARKPIIPVETSFIQPGFVIETKVKF